MSNMCPRIATDNTADVFGGYSEIASASQLVTIPFGCATSTNFQNLRLSQFCKVDILAAFAKFRIQPRWMVVTPAHALRMHARWVIITAQDMLRRNGPSAFLVTLTDVFLLRPEFQVVGTNAAPRGIVSSWVQLAARMQGKQAVRDISVAEYPGKLMGADQPIVNPKFTVAALGERTIKECTGGVADGLRMEASDVLRGIVNMHRATPNSSGVPRPGLFPQRRGFIALSISQQGG